MSVKWRLPEYPSINSLQILLTRSCQLSCRYCRQTEKYAAMPDSRISACVDLLLASDDEQVRLQWFGGEPLLRCATIIRQSRAALAKARKAGKTMKFGIATNAFLLTPERVRALAEFPVEYILSIDGALPKQRYQRPFKAAAGKYPYERLVAAIGELNRLKQPYFVNMVTLPGREASLEEDVDHFLALGVGTFRFSYAMGADWTPAASRAYFKKVLQVCVSKKRQGVKWLVLNPRCMDEPDLISPTPAVDCDGGIYFGSALPPLEKNFPEVLAATKLGRLGDFSRLSQLKLDRQLALKKVRRAYPAGSRKGRIVKSNLRMGLLSHELFGKMARAGIVRAE